ncbi:MAG: type II secretion system protein [Candidatus Pacebacteria bacterium]|nr:type II secretion system protein [Candidatus Paceibacterota bacterium]
MHTNYTDIKIKGFTLIESIMALGVIGIGLVIVLQVFPSGFSVEKNTQLETQATLCGQEKIEELLSKSFSELSVGTVVDGSLPTPFEKFSRATKISFINSNLEESASATTFKKIEVAVSWNSPLRIGSKEIKLITLFAEK